MYSSQDLSDRNPSGRGTSPAPFPAWEALWVRAYSPRTCLSIPAAEAAEAGGRVSTSRGLLLVSPSLGDKSDDRRLEPRRSSAPLGAEGWLRMHAESSSPPHAATAPNQLWALRILTLSCPTSDGVEGVDGEGEVAANVKGTPRWRGWQVNLSRRREKPEAGG